MTLYDKINNAIEVDAFLNDTMLYVGGKITWGQAFDKYPLDPSELQEHASSITFWQDKYDLAADDYGRRLVRVEMQDNLAGAYIGCDREAIDEATFKSIIGETITVEGIARVLPFLVDRDQT